MARPKLSVEQLKLNKQRRNKEHYKKTKEMKADSQLVLSNIQRNMMYLDGESRQLVEECLNKVERSIAMKEAFLSLVKLSEC